MLICKQFQIRFSIIWTLWHLRRMLVFPLSIILEKYIQDAWFKDLKHENHRRVIAHISVMMMDIDVNIYSRQGPKNFILNCFVLLRNLELPINICCQCYINWTLKRNLLYFKGQGWLIIDKKIRIWNDHSLVMWCQR